MLALHAAPPAISRHAAPTSGAGHAPAGDLVIMAAGARPRAELARAAGLDSVMDRCVKIEHARLFGGLNWVGVNTGVISARRPLP